MVFNHAAKITSAVLNTAFTCFYIYSVETNYIPLIEKDGFGKLPPSINLLVTLISVMQVTILDKYSSKVCLFFLNLAIHKTQHY